jgi:RNA polymerase sigma-54 factor
MEYDMVHKLAHHQRMFQKMTLTPQMRHSIQLLGMSTKDINEYIESAMESNPFLKKAYDEKRAEKYDGNLSSWGDSDTYYDRADSLNRQEEDPRAALLSQLRILNLDDNSLGIAEHLISEMDDNGYIKVELEGVAHDFVVSIEEIENCLTAIQSLDPPGIGARDVRECLQLQLKRMNKENSLEYTIVSEFINELARTDIDKISKALNADNEKIKAAVDNIKKLNPRPASTMLSKGSQHIIPDLIAKVTNNKILLKLNREWLPRLNFYNPYENDSDIANDPEANKFMKENRDSAKNLIDGLKRREETISKVADYIVSFHENELINNIEEIKSLTIKEISSALNLHPSTITRTVANKYIQIENRVMPLKHLLSHSIKKENGETTSKIAVKKRIEEFVKNEDKSRPLSDKAIQEKLAQGGIILQRRTIAKYRSALRILPTYLRKKMG